MKEQVMLGWVGPLNVDVTRLMVVLSALYSRGLDVSELLGNKGGKIKGFLFSEYRIRTHGSEQRQAGYIWPIVLHFNLSGDLRICIPKFKQGVPERQALVFGARQVSVANAQAIVDALVAFLHEHLPERA